MIEIIDNFLEDDYLKILQNYFLGSHCDWYFNSNLTDTDDTLCEDLNSFGFAVRLYWNGCFFKDNHSNFLEKLLFSAQNEVEKVTKEKYKVIRARADMTLYNPNQYRHSLHVDMFHEHMTAIFYMNTSDGNTLLFDRDGRELLQEVEPVENRLVIFDGLMQHTGHSPAKHKSRVLINMNFMNPELVNELNRNYKHHE